MSEVEEEESFHRSNRTGGREGRGVGRGHFFRSLYFAAPWPWPWFQFAPHGASVFFLFPHCVELNCTVAVGLFFVCLVAPQGALGDFCCSLD